VTPITRQGSAHLFFLGRRKPRSADGTEVEMLPSARWAGHPRLLFTSAG
jgi:hypothetical protein